MGFKKLMIVAVAVMAALSFQACKKNKSDDKYTASPTIPGTLRFDAPVFVAKGDVLNLVPRGLQADTIDVGYAQGRIRTEYHRTHHTGGIPEAEDPVAAGAV